MTHTIALVDGRDESRAELAAMLRAAGCAVASYAGWRTARPALGESVVDAVVLCDWRRCGGRGALRYLRRPAREAPFIAITDGGVAAGDSRFAAVLGYPVSAEALMDALRAAIGDRRPLELGRFRLDSLRRALVSGADSVLLTPIECDLLRVLMLAGGDFVPSDRLMARAWGIAALTDRRMLYTHIAWLRRKLAALEAGDLIASSRGRGYRFALPQD